MWNAAEQYQFFEAILFKTFGLTMEITDIRFVSGGSINTAARVSTLESTFFIKFNHSEHEDMFEKEAKGLALLQQTNALCIPEVLGFGEYNDKSYLVLEFIENGGQRPDFWQDFGRSLSILHSHTHSSFGLSFDNYIGSLEQQNQYYENGIDFFVEKRLRPMVGLALYNGLITPYLRDCFEQFYPLLPSLLPNEKPSLLHGDLWSGNFLSNPYGYVCLIDPAPYYGLREAEIAFTHLFGGFDDEFYESYNESYRLTPNFQSRIPLYNLYPLLVHVNLFGKSYLPPIERLVRRFVGSSK
ncbi:fructosamine kinase family protein [Runella sp. MFBS21]|uniref:fructosamine kinase family protein n=1 Tax=Runella sp. MFBS21 TaxID=3034018 RepID=UPI0023F85847|nr:fructosamine kinase family protein [Runella sp. MFBS21]MDF7817817.1 fructosamine kinase family protein [Runella sp. MFBS21]